MLKIACWVQGSCQLPFGDTAFLTTDLDMDLKLQTSNSGGARGKEVGDFKCSQEADRNDFYTIEILSDFTACSQSLQTTSVF